MLNSHCIIVCALWDYTICHPSTKKTFSQTPVLIPLKTKLCKKRIFEAIYCTSAFSTKSKKNRYSFHREAKQWPPAPPEIRPCRTETAISAAMSRYFLPMANDRKEESPLRVVGDLCSGQFVTADPSN